MQHITSMSQVEHGTAEQWLCFFFLIPPLLADLVLLDLLELVACSGKYRIVVTRTPVTESVIEMEVGTRRRVRELG
eukprot:gene9499-biopygen2511